MKRTGDLVALIDCAYSRQSWHGTNLRGSLRGLTLGDVTWRPARGRHNIWELVVHCAYWKYVVRRRLTGAKRGSFPLDGSNFFARPSTARSADIRAWKADLALLDDMHRELRDVVARIRVPKTFRPGSARHPTALWLVQGVAAHDLYHAGQIQLIKRLRR